jgi:hypothetical protein
MRAYGATEDQENQLHAAKWQIEGRGDEQGVADRIRTQNLFE